MSSGSKVHVSERHLMSGCCLSKDHLFNLFHLSLPGFKFTFSQIEIIGLHTIPIATGSMGGFHRPIRPSAEHWMAWHLTAYTHHQWCLDLLDPAEKAWPKFRSGRLVWVRPRVNGVKAHMRATVAMDKFYDLLRKTIYCILRKNIVGLLTDELLSYSQPPHTTDGHISTLEIFWSEQNLLQNTKCTETRGA